MFCKQKDDVDVKKSKKEVAPVPPEKVPLIYETDNEGQIVILANSVRKNRERELRDKCVHPMREEFTFSVSSLT
jgi:hypothetical protein